MQTQIFKSYFDPGVFAGINFGSSSGIYDQLNWPVDQSAFLTLYQASPEHARCIQLKAEGAFGLGVVGEKAEIIDDLCAISSAELFTNLDSDLGVFGNAFMEVIRSGNGQIIGFDYLPAVTMYRNTNLQDFVQIIYMPDGTDKDIHFKANEVIHFKHYDPTATWYGLPMWQAGTGMIELADAAVKWNKTFFQNHAMPSYAVLIKGEALSEEQTTAAKEYFSSNFKGSDNSQKTLVLHQNNVESSIEFKKLTDEAKDGDFLKLLDSIKERIAIAHGVPGKLLGFNFGTSLGGGSEINSQMHSFETLTLQPNRRRMRDRLKPLLRELNIKTKEIEFKGIDVTPPEMDNKKVLDMHQNEIIDTLEARELLDVDDDISKTLEILKTYK